MALISRAQAKPGFAQASQTPFAIGPGGGGFGDLLSRQFALREQMQQAQLAQMQQDLLFQKQNQMRQGDIYGKSRMTQGVLSGVKPGTMAYENMQKAEQRARSYDMAEVLGRASIGSLGTTPHIAKMINAIGGPRAAQEGLMQSGRIMGQLGSQAIGAGAQLGSNQMRSDAMRYEADKRAQTALQMQQLQFQQPQFQQQPTGEQQGMEKGGRVPSTGTYKLHKGEVVVPRKASDVMFPYAGGGPKRSEGKARKSYQLGTGALTKTQKDALLPEDEWRKKLGRNPTPTEWADRQRIRMELNTAVGYMTPTREVPTASLAGPLLDPGVSPYMTDPLDYGAYAPPVDPEQVMAPEGAPGTPGYTAPTPTEWPTEPLAAPSGGGITYEGPGIGGMTQFGVPGELGQYGPLQPGRHFGLGQVAKGDDLVDMRRKEDEILILDRRAASAEGRGDRIARYLDENPNPDQARKLVAMIKENDRAGQRWRNRAKALREQVSETRAMMVGQAIATMEQETERYKIKTEGDIAKGEAASSEFQTLQDNLIAASKILGGKEPNDYAVGNYQRAIIAAFMPFLDRFTFLGDTKEDRMASLAQTALMMANADNEQQLAAAQAQYTMLLEAAEGIGG